MRASRLTIREAVLVAMIVVACKGGGETSDSSKTGTSAGAIGVTECDEYVNKVRKVRVGKRAGSVARPAHEQRHCDARLLEAGSVQSSCSGGFGAGLQAGACDG
jgi:hypothetical protein